MSTSNVNAVPNYKDQARAGDTYTLESRYKQDNTLRDFTGFTFRSQMRERVTSTTVSATPVCTSTELGIVSCTLDKDTTQALVPDNKLFVDYVYDIEAISGTGTVETLLDVSVRFTQGTTR